MGSYLNESETGSARVAGPSLVFYRAGAPHRNVACEAGFEQVELEFDPRWLGESCLPELPVIRWSGAGARPCAVSLARVCRVAGSETELRNALRSVLQKLNSAGPERPAGWTETVRQRLFADTTLRVSELARALGRHPSWLGHAYRRSTGEGLLETAARLKVERASCGLRETEQPYATVAQEAGFCDQSHMNRTFRRVLDRTPSEVREDRRYFRSLARTA
jgi:AraC family transcriptional regulator